MEILLTLRKAGFFIEKIMNAFFLMADITNLRTNVIQLNNFEFFNNQLDDP